MSNDEDDHGQRTHSAFCEKVAPDCGEKKVCSDVDDEVGEMQATKVHDDGLEAGKATAFNMQRAARPQ